MMSRKSTSCLSFGSAPMLSSMEPGGRGRSWSVMTSAFAFGIRGDSPELVLYFTYAVDEVDTCPGAAGPSAGRPVPSHASTCGPVMSPGPP